MLKKGKSKSFSFNLKMIIIGMFVVLTFDCVGQSYSPWYSETTLLRDVKVTNIKHTHQGSSVVIFKKDDKHFFIETRKGYWRKTYIKLKSCKK